MNSMLAAYGQAELIIGLGALIVLLTDLVFAIFGDYSFSTVTWIAAAVALVTVVMHRRLPGGFAGQHRTILIGAATIAVLMSVRDLLVDLLFIPGRNLDVTFFLGMVGLYVGVALMAYGAWRLWKSA